jgi:glycine cleavage system H protein
MNLPPELKYTKEHEWVKVEGNVATTGITDYAQKELGDIVFVELLEAGIEVEQEKEMTTIESVKAASDLFAPVSGKVVECNQALEDQPELVNKDPYGQGWIAKIELKDPAEVDGLLSAKDYQKLVEEAK